MHNPSARRQLLLCVVRDAEQLLGVADGRWLGVALTDGEPGPVSLRSFERAAVAVATAVGTIARFATASHLWLDEALTVNIARLPLSQIPSALRQDGHPPLFYFLLHAWMAMVGQSDLAVRSLSGVLSVVALPLAFRVGLRVGGRVAAWAFLGFLALSPFAIRYGTETRMYALVMTLVLAGYLLVANALERSTRPRLIGLAVVVGALVLSHYWALWLLAATLLVVATVAVRNGGERRRNARRILVALLAGALFLVPWLGVMGAQAAHTGTPWASPVRPTTLLTTSLQDFGGGDYGEALLLGWSLAGLFVIGLTATTIDRHRLQLDVRTVPAVRAEAAIVAVTIAVAALAGAMTRTTFATRYAAVFFPLFLLVAAVGVSRFAAPAVRGAVGGFVLVLGLVGGVHNVVTDRTQAGEAAAAIRAGAHPGDLVLICPDQLGPSLHRLLPATLGLTDLTYPTLDTPDRVDWRDYAARNARVDPLATADLALERTPAAGAVWLVFSGSYKTLAGQCEAVAQELSARLGAGQTVVAEDGDKFFEHEAVVRFSAHR